MQFNIFHNEPFLVINPDTIWNFTLHKRIKDEWKKDFFSNKRGKCSTA